MIVKRSLAPYALLGVATVGFAAAAAVWTHAGSTSAVRPNSAPQSASAHATPSRIPVGARKTYAQIRGDEVFSAASPLDLARLSTTVVVGRITDVRYEVRNAAIPEAQDGIYTLRVERALRGQAVAATLEVRVFSRIDGKEAALEGQAPPEVGRRYLLFLRTHPRIPTQFEVTNSKGAYALSDDGHVSRDTATENPVVKGLNGRSIDEVKTIVDR